MPAVVGRPPPPARPRLVPRRVALAVQPELERSTIPSRVTLDATAPPFAGELREEQHGPRLPALPVGPIRTLATLRRAWNFVGFMVDPGDAGAPGLIASLRILTRGGNAIGPQVVVNAGGPQAFVGFIIGAQCELVVANASGAVAHGVRGVIWGMSER